jgi:nucleoside-diphosphate-sugar epimerase
LKKLKRKIAIVGGAGFIGKSIARHLSRQFEVKILDTQKLPKDLEGLVGYSHCDVRNYHEVAEGLDDVNLAIHTAIVQIPLINEQKKLAYEVNVVGTQNVCKAVEENPNVKGMILTGTWHTVGERGLEGTIDEEFGFRPDKVESRARLYALSKIAQESIVRFYDEMSEKIYGIIRMGTVLGEGMPEKTAANIFIEKGLKGEAITPYKHSMYRPMLYANVGDICQAFEAYAKKILNDQMEKSNNSIAHIVNVYYPEPITILELAELVKESITKCSGGKVKPKIEIIDNNVPLTFTQEDKNRLKIDVNKAKQLLGLEKLNSPKESILEIVKSRTYRN